MPSLPAVFFLLHFLEFREDGMECGSESRHDFHFADIDGIDPFHLFHFIWFSDFWCIRLIPHCVKKECDIMQAFFFEDAISECDLFDVGDLESDFFMDFSFASLEEGFTEFHMSTGEAP